MTYVFYICSRLDYWYVQSKEESFLSLGDGSTWEAKSIGVVKIKMLSDQFVLQEVWYMFKDAIESHFLIQFDSKGYEYSVRGEVLKVKL